MEPKRHFLTTDFVQSRGSMALTTRATISFIVALSSVSTYRAAPALTHRFGGLTRQSYDLSLAQRIVVSQHAHKCPQCLL
jgi:hypothetical protein